MSFLTCWRLRPLLTRYADGEVPAAERVIVDRHLADCEACLRRVRIEEAVRGIYALEPLAPDRRRGSHVPSCPLGVPAGGGWHPWRPAAVASFPPDPRGARGRRPRGPAGVLGQPVAGARSRRGGPVSSATATATASIVRRKRLTSTRPTVFRDVSERAPTSCSSQTG